MSNNKYTETLREFAARAREMANEVAGSAGSLSTSWLSETINKGTVATVKTGETAAKAAQSIWARTPEI